jgi:hypothetical protein
MSGLSLSLSLSLGNLCVRSHSYGTDDEACHCLLSATTNNALLCEPPCTVRAMHLSLQTSLMRHERLRPSSTRLPL